jgi:hypothetical protein
MLGLMMLMFHRTHSTDPGSSTPYRDLLHGLAAVGDHDADMVQLLMSMATCIDENSYGTLRLLYRLLPLRDRRALGYPPANREEDEHTAT